MAAAASSLMAAPAAAATTETVSAQAQLIRSKIYFGRCRDTCQIKVRITNISRRNLYNVKLNVRLKVSGRKAGTCYDYVGRIGARKVRWASCTVRTRSLSEMYNAALDGYASFRPYASTYVSYRYYR
ncbi:hypothetical protein [Nonomuraea solani]|uniref:hypothetical protein n=1 Tax=Nonomuraea solani TaxID=1144553 RepID=UPI0011B0E2CA|nr:hypothetical protein [Nonomuraea solani]